MIGRPGLPTTRAQGNSRAYGSCLTQRFPHLLSREKTGLRRDAIQASFFPQRERKEWGTLYLQVISAFPATRSPARERPAQRNVLWVLVLVSAVLSGHKV